MSKFNKFNSWQSIIKEHAQLKIDNELLKVQRKQDKRLLKEYAKVVKDHIAWQKATKALLKGLSDACLPLQAGTEAVKKM